MQIFFVMSLQILRFRFIDSLQLHRRRRRRFHCRMKAKAAIVMSCKTSGVADQYTMTAKS